MQGDCEWYLTLNEPGQPTRYWNTHRKTWEWHRADASRYGHDRRSANRALGQRRRHGPEAERQYLDIAYLWVNQRCN